ncbi:MAG: glycosyltransferase family 2 protein [Ferruginibacter sp.]|nr:glycosyltransferase family 2 protein [Ferruginibacter sp.]
MKVVGFSFIKDAVKMQYPIVEAIQSILPLCDEVIVAVGASADGTRELVANIDSKVKIIDTEWDFNLKENGKILAVETNKAFKEIPPDADWCIYIQGDEVLHEDGYDEIKQAMHTWKADKKVDGLLLKYKHFFGSYDYVGIESHWYRNEVRIIKNNKNFYSYRDAQGFRKDDNKKLNVKKLNAYIHHYGWVQSPLVMKAKNDYKVKIYNNGAYDENNTIVPDDYTNQLVNALQKYTLPHPKVMQQRIAAVNWKFNYNETTNKLSVKDKFKNITEKLFGVRLFDYRNYKVV